MSDPFPNPSDHRKVLREARVGVLVLVLLIGFFAYVVYYRVERFKSQLPQYVLDAPVAKHVEPDSYFRSLDSEAVERPVQQYASQPLQAVPPPPAKEVSVAPTVKRLVKPVNEPSEPVSKVVMASATEPAESKYVGDFGVPKKEIELPFVEKPKRIVPVKKKTEIDSNANDSKLSDSKAVDNSFLPLGSPPKSDEFTKSDRPMEDDFAPVKAAVPVAAPSFAADFAPLQPRTDRIEQSDTTAEVQQLTPPSGNSFLPTMEAESIEEPIEELLVEDPEPVPVATNAAAPVARTPVFEQPVVSMEVNSRSNQPIEVASESGGNAESTNPLKEYTVQPGDSYWAIAQTVYEDGRLFRALFEHNRSQQVSFENLEPGAVLSTPSPDILLIKYPELCPPDLVRKSSQTKNDAPGVYQTVDGDTLFGIARDRLGQASRYLEILQLNQEILPRDINHLMTLESGLELKLPR